MPGDRFTVGALDTEIVIHDKDELASIIADFVRAALDEVGPVYPEATASLKWRGFFVFVAVSYGDVVDEPGDGHPSVRPSSN